MLEPIESEERRQTLRRESDKIFSNYMTKDECEKTHTEKERYYNGIIKQSVEDRKRLLKDADKLELEVDHYKEKINGKFDKIMWSVIGLLVMICGSALSTIYIQISTKLDMDKGRAHYQSISEENNKELGSMLKELKNVTIKMNESKNK